ncbi:MAG: hypothetical protein R3E18_05805 [Sphingomonadaceae bacterium]|nr:hypothetical protein [Sphingomonadaceae bacterium]
MALAMALAMGGAVAVAGYAEPAYAAKKEKAGKSNYTKEFVAIYQPLANKANAEGADANALKAEIAPLLAEVKTDDDKMAAGQLLYNIGTKSQDLGLQRQGMDLMLESGKVSPESQPQYLFVSGQLAYQAKDWAAARDRVQQAIAAGYTKNDPEAIIAEAYFNEGREAEGLSYLSGVIAQREAAGAAVPVEWIKRGLTVAYRGNIGAEARKYSVMLVKYDPTRDSWGDAIAIERSFFNYDNQEVLDLMRLARRTDALRSERDYVDYIEAADPRRLPGEVKAVTDEGIAAGKLRKGDVFVTDALNMSSGRIAADKADLPGLARDARAASSKAVTATAAGDAFLSYGDAPVAEEMYKIAMGKAGVDMDRVMTRLGIAQLEQGKYAEAVATFAKVSGVRKPIADLWTLHAQMEAGDMSGQPAA